MRTNTVAELLTAILPGFEYVVAEDYSNVDLKEVNDEFKKYEYGLIDSKTYQNLEIKKGLKIKTNNGNFYLKNKMM